MIESFYRTIGIAATVLVFVSFLHAAPPGKTIYIFQGGTNGQYPTSLIVDSKGNLFGTSFLTDSAQGCSMAYCELVFELSPGSNGTWAYQVLYEFLGIPNGTAGTGLTLDEAGNLYGAQIYGGANNQGFVFELSPGAGGNWTENVLYNFGSYPGDGLNPRSVLVFDVSGDLYGTTTRGGTDDYGTAYQLIPKAGSGWTENIIHNFSGYPSDGWGPEGSLTIDSAGNLYGTTPSGGGHEEYCELAGYGAGCGTVYELSPPSIQGGAWTENILHDFAGYVNGDGQWPFNGVVMDSAGNLFGNTYGGGDGEQSGTVFELSPMLNGAWAATIICRASHDTPCYGIGSPAPALDTSGHVYGEQFEGGAHGYGYIYRLTPIENHPKLPWTYNTKYNFFGNSDGDSPDGLVSDGEGHFYGITYYGGNGIGNAGDGTIFEATIP